MGNKSGKPPRVKIDAKYITEYNFREMEYHPPKKPSQRFILDPNIDRKSITNFIPIAKEMKKKEMRIIALGMDINNGKVISFHWGNAYISNDTKSPINMKYSNTYEDILNNPEMNIDDMLGKKKRHSFFL